MSGKSKNVAETIVETLEAHGVAYIFGVPGEENLTFLEALRSSQRKSKIKFITTRHEQGAAFMAATFGRMTGKIGVALSTLGPGATNLMTGAAYAQLGGFPLLLITGQKPIRKSKQGKFQIVDVVGMMKPVTKFSTTITSGEKVIDTLKEVITLAESERPGAVHIELPEDIALEVSNENPATFSEAVYQKADEKNISEAVKTIENAKSPVIILGRGAGKAEVVAELQKFFTKTKIPFVSTQMGKGVIDETSDLSIGTTALSQGELVHQALRGADVIITIGHDVIEKPPIILTKENLPNCEFIHINYSSSVAPNVYVPTLEVLGDLASSISVLTKKIQVNPDWDFTFFFKIRDGRKKALAKFSSSEDFPLRPERIISDIQKVLPKDGILTLDNGMYKLWIARNFPARLSFSVLLDNTLATMGAGLPSGMALKMLYPKRKVLVVAGDGGIMMNIAELETAVRLKLDLVVLILDDSGYGMISWKQKDMKLPNFALSFSNPDFVMLAKSFGAVGYKVEKTDDLAKILKESLNSKGVHIIACPISYEEANKALVVKES